MIFNFDFNINFAITNYFFVLLKNTKVSHNFVLRNISSDINYTSYLYILFLRKTINLLYLNVYI